MVFGYTMLTHIYVMVYGNKCFVLYFSLVLFNIPIYIYIYALRFVNFFYDPLIYTFLFLLPLFSTHTSVLLPNLPPHTYAHIYCKHIRVYAYNVYIYIYNRMVDLSIQLSNIYCICYICASKCII